MKVTQSAQIRAQIDKYKRFLEKPELFMHAVQLHDQYYYNVQYWRWGKNEAVGYLILQPDGTVVPRDEAEPVVRLFMSHNNAVINFTRDFAADKEKPVWMYEQKRDLLQALLPACRQVMDESTLQAAYDVLEMCDFVAQRRDRLEAVYEQGMRHHNRMLSRGYVLAEDEEALRDALYESDFLLYERLKKQVAVRDAVDRLTAFMTRGGVFADSELEKKRKKLCDLLREYKDEGLRKINDQSVLSFETETVSYQTASQLANSYRKQNDRLLSELVVSILRNP